jgi:hypothetical protein
MQATHFSGINVRPCNAKMNPRIIPDLPSTARPDPSRSWPNASVQALLKQVHLQVVSHPLYDEVEEKLGIIHEEKKT